MLSIRNKYAALPFQIDTDFAEAINMLLPTFSLSLKLFACVFRMNSQWLNVGINMYPCNKYALPQ